MLLQHCRLYVAGELEKNVKNSDSDKEIKLIRIRPNNFSVGLYLILKT